MGLVVAGGQDQPHQAVRREQDHRRLPAETSPAQAGPAPVRPRDHEQDHQAVLRRQDPPRHRLRLGF